VSETSEVKCHATQIHGLELAEFARDSQ